MKSPPLRLLLLLATTGLTACAYNPIRKAVYYPAPDGGIVIAQTVMEPGVPVTSIPLLGPVPDCDGPAVAIKNLPGATTGLGTTTYGPNAEPCAASVTLFDGRFDTRAADPAITITFHDGLGRPTSINTTELPTLPAVPAIRVTSQLLPNTPATIEPAAGPQPTLSGPQKAPSDPLVTLLNQWENGAPRPIQTGSYDEASAAAARTLTRTVEKTRANQLQAESAKLLATLREKERALQEEQRRADMTRQLALESRAETNATKQAYAQEQAKITAQLQATQSRLAELEAQNARLAAEKARTQSTYQQRIASLSSDLKSANAQASRSRNELIREAAAKIAEAEALANAARMAEADANAREAARKKDEAQAMMARAMDLANGQSVVLSDINTPTQPAPMALMQVPIALHVKDATPPQILAEVLKQTKGQAGEWKPDWQLPAAQSYILAEKWSLTAEAPVQQVLAQLTAQIKAAHGLTLQFTQFPQSRLLVVTLTE